MQTAATKLHACAVTPWDEYCRRAYAAVHPAPQPVAAAPDLIDFTFSLDHIRLEIDHLLRLLREAAECDAERRPTVRAHRLELNQILAELALLAAEAEAA